MYRLLSDRCYEQEEGQTPRDTRSMLLPTHRTLSTPRSATFDSRSIDTSSSEATHTQPATGKAPVQLGKVVNLRHIVSLQCSSSDICRRHPSLTSSTLLPCFSLFPRCGPLRHTSHDYGFKSPKETLTLILTPRRTT